MNQKKALIAIPLAAICVTLWGVLILSGSRVPTVSAAPLLQLTDFPTPTPGPDGRILYIVQSGDTLWRISAVSGISLDELRRLNNLTAEDTIREGQTLLLGFGGPSELPTTPPEVISAPTLDTRNLPPTPTPSPQFGLVCVLLFDDVDGDAIRQEEETAIFGGAVSITERTGQFSANKEIVEGLLEAMAADEDNLDPRVCFENLLEGEYNVSVAIPEGYNPTTPLNASFLLTGESEVYLDFGAQPGSNLLAEQSPVAERGSPLYAVIGALLVAAGLGYSIFGTRGNNDTGFRG